MNKTTIAWITVLDRIKEKTGASMLETLRTAGIGGHAAEAMTQRQRKADLKYDEGLVIQGIYEGLFNEPMPTRQRPDKQRCGSCNLDKPIEFIFRVADGQYKCGTCIKNINTQYQKAYRETRSLRNAI